MKIIIKLLFVLCNILFDSISLAESTSEKYNVLISKIFTYKANFTQTTYDENNNVIQQSSGSVKLKKPNKIFWKTEKPHKQTIVSNKETAWIFDEDLDQVTIQKKLNTKEYLPIYLLMGNSKNLNKHYKVIYKKQNHQETFRFIPIFKSNEIEEIILTFNNTKLEEISINDILKQITLIKFTNVTYNLDLDDRNFKFIIPKGVDVINS